MAKVLPKKVVGLQREKPLGPVEAKSVKIH
jgi:hypothetical protein